MILFLLGFISTIFIDFQELMGNEKPHISQMKKQVRNSCRVEGETIEEPIEKQKISNIKILAIGDIMFHSPQYNAAFNGRLMSMILPQF